MGWPVSGGTNNIYSDQSGRNRLLDTLHASQEDANSVGIPSCVPHAIDFTSKMKTVIAVFLVMLKVLPVDGHVLVTVLDPVIGAMEGMTVNLTCEITDDQGAGVDEISIYWRKEQTLINVINSTFWDKDTQRGNTTLQLTNVSMESAGIYICLVKIKWSFDYKRITLGVMAWQNNLGIKVSPYQAIVDIWDGPPLKINCPFTTQQECSSMFTVTWWKSGGQDVWEQPGGRSDLQVESNNGVGWLNDTQARVEKSKGVYLCVISCGTMMGYGKREVQRKSHLTDGLRPTHGIYQANRGTSVILGCQPERGIVFSEFGWWFRKGNVQEGEKYQLEKRLEGMLTLVIQDVQPEDEGAYECWIAQDAWWTHAVTLVSLTKARTKKRRFRDIEIGNKTWVFHHNPEQENLIVGLIRDFGKMQNVSKITACLPLPRAAGEPIPWGIIPVNGLPRAYVNVTWSCRLVPYEYYEWVEGCMLIRRVTEQQCRQVPGYYAWLTTSNQGNECVVAGSTSEPCSRVTLRNKKVREEEVCQNVTQTQSLEDEWGTIWGPSLLETYSYLGQVNWCIQWTGSNNQTYTKVMNLQTTRREKKDQKDIWNCTQVITCDTPEDKIGLVPVRVLLKWGCECRGYNHTITDQIQGDEKGKRNISCKSTTIRSPGNLVWVMGHGKWTTHMPIDGPVTQITLGIPTICPFWRQSKLTLQPARTKRELDDENEWHEPDGGVKFGWALESLFSPIAAYRNRDMLYKLMGQTERLAATTRKGFKDLNLQLQATTRMTLQNRMALDMLLLKEHGVCGYLSQKIDHCCIHIPNVTIDVEKDISQLKQIEDKTKDLEKEAEHNWIGEVFSSLGLQVSGWISSVVQYAIMFLILILIIFGVYKCILGTIGKERLHIRRLINAMTRNTTPSTSPPADKEERL